MSQHSDVILLIIAEVDRIDADAHAKYAFKRFINEACLAAGITVIDRKERIHFARRLLDGGEPRPVIRDRLMERFGIKRASAYAAIDAALQLSNKPAIYWTRDTQNNHIQADKPDEGKSDDHSKFREHGRQ